MPHLTTAAPAARARRIAAATAANALEFYAFVTYAYFAPSSPCTEPRIVTENVPPSFRIRAGCESAALT